MAVDDEYCSIPIDLVLKYSAHIPFDMFLKLSEGKVVKISHSDDDVNEEIQHFKEKGITNIYARKEEYIYFLQQIKDGLTYKFFETEKTVEAQITTLDKSYEVLKKSLGMIGMSKISIEMGQEIAAKSMKLIQSQSNLAKFFKEFKDKCRREFMSNILVSYTASCMIDTFTWTSPSMKEKASLAIMLRDILLDEEDFEELRLAESKDDLSKRILEHPTQTAALLESEKNKSIPSDVVSMVAHHHEEPDGTGFPMGLGHLRINQLLAIIIVADRFIQLMLEYKFDIDKKNDIITILYSKYRQGTFLKAVQAIQKIFP